MEGYRFAGKLSDFRDGIVRTFQIDGDEIAVVSYKDHFYAFSGRCTHEDYSFNYTRVRPGDVIICSSHIAVFDLATGKHVGGQPADDLSRYDIRVDGEGVFVSKTAIRDGQG